MAEFDARIREAIDSSRDMLAKQLSTTGEIMVGLDSEPSLQRYNDLPDDEPFSRVAPDPENPRPDRIIVPSYDRDSYIRLVDATASKLHFDRSDPGFDSNFELQVERAYQYIDAINVLGPQATFLTVTLELAQATDQQDYPEDLIVVMPNNVRYVQNFTLGGDGTYETTKLGFASVLAHPLRTSPDEELALMELGYQEGIQEVGGLIEEHNATGAEQQLLLPLSYRPQSS